MIHHDWPGNIRELINALEYAFVLCKDGNIHTDHLPMGIPEPACFSGGQAPMKAVRGRSVEKIKAALDQTGGRKGEAAKLLGISRVTLWKHMKRYGLEKY